MSFNRQLLRAIDLTSFATFWGKTARFCMQKMVDDEILWQAKENRIFYEDFTSVALVCISDEVCMRKMSYNRWVLQGK